MDSSPSWHRRLADTLGPPGAALRLADRVWRVEAGGRAVVVKTGPGIADEAAGLAWIAACPGGPGVPEVLLDEEDLLVLAWVDTRSPTAAHEEALGRTLAVLHGDPVPAWGGGSSWIGPCPVAPDPGPDGPGFYGRRLLDLARRCGLESAVTPVADRLPDLVPWDQPRRLHGDLWWGNVLWGLEARPVVIDPSHHGGHPEEDLAMLALFGSVAPRILASYQEVAALADGWEHRVGLWQLLPLLVHAVAFGGPYLGRSAALAARYAR